MMLMKFDDVTQVMAALFLILDTALSLKYFLVLEKIEYNN